jgi:hypothetical protein
VQVIGALDRDLDRDAEDHDRAERPPPPTGAGCARQRGRLARRAALAEPGRNARGRSEFGRRRPRSRRRVH